jgi:hypothetical protein
LRFARAGDHDLACGGTSPLDWNQALQVAAARLGEQYILADTAKHPLLADQVQWLAALLCAYGKLAEEVDRMQARAAEPPVSKSR